MCLVEWMCVYECSSFKNQIPPPRSSPQPFGTESAHPGVHHRVVWRALVSSISAQPVVSLGKFMLLYLDRIGFWVATLGGYFVIFVILMVGLQRRPAASCPALLGSCKKNP